MDETLLKKVIEKNKLVQRTLCDRDKLRLCADRLCREMTYCQHPHTCLSNGVFK